MIRALIFSAALALPAAIACAAEPDVPPTAGKPCESRDFHDFDFWIGEWNVYAEDGTLAGTNSITREEYGCLLVERWTNTDGITGQSYNFFDPDTDQWRQIWVSAGSVIDYAGQIDETGAMRLAGRITYHRNGKSSPFQGTWTPNEDGTVTQHFEQQEAASGEWSTWFIGKYVRQPEG